MRKIILIPFFFLLFLVIAVAVIPHFVPTDAYRNMVERRIASNLDARVVMDKFSLRILPTPGYTIKNLNVVSASEPFVGLTLFKAGRVEGSLSLISLLKGRVKTKVKIYDANVDYRIKDGLSNLGIVFGWNLAGIQAGGSVQVPGDEGERDENDEGEKESEEGYEEVPIKAMPALSGDGDTSLNLIGLFEGTAHAEEIPQGMRVFPGGREVSDLEITALDIVDGTISMHDEAGDVTILAGRVDLAARHFSYSEGASSMGFGGVVGADVRLNAAILGSNVPNFSITGKFTYDGMRKEISTKEARLYLLGVQMSADAMIGLGLDPQTFDLHFAAASFTPAMLMPVLPASLKELLFDFNWQGTMAGDLRAVGSKRAFDLELKVDATGASVTHGRILSKSAGQSLKFSTSMKVGEDDVSISQAEFMLGKDKLEFRGDVDRNDGLTSMIRLSGSALNDGDIKPYFPMLVVLDSFEGLSFSMDMEGDLIGKNAFMRIMGNAKARKSEVAGIFIDDLGLSFARDETGVIIPTISGIVASGTLTGNASVLAGDKTEYSFEGAVSDLNTAQITATGGAMRGNGSLILKAATAGNDPLTVSSEIKMVGSLMVPSGSWNSISIGQSVYSTDTYRALEALCGAPLSEVEKVTQTDVSDDFTDLNVEFEYSTKGVELTGTSWANPKYSMEGVEAKILLPSRVDMEGDDAGGAFASKAKIAGDALFIVPKSIAMQLVVGEESQSILLDANGRLVMPVTMKGTLKDVDLALDQVKFAKAIEEREDLAAPPEGEPAEVIREDENADESKPKPLIQVAPDEAKTKTTTETKPRRRTREKKKPAEEILRVIIGE